MNFSAIDYLGPGLYLLCGGFRVLGGQSVVPSASEADVDPGLSLGLELEQCDVSTR
ncbi:hypothetical protein [Mesorhizobium montanum]|uniref:hypothetical protein n=1 Tax=Mesorhizobium montanum TaxID=3072323 RepID=UPI002A23FB4A|nr:hypothetical protein [Mesorhizobium sp. MSK_1335]